MPCQNNPVASGEQILSAHVDSESILHYKFCMGSHLLGFGLLQGTFSSGIAATCEPGSSRAETTVTGARPHTSIALDLTRDAHYQFIL